MTRVAIAVLALVVSTICCTASASESFDPSALITPPNLRTATYMLPMRDGILLHTDVDFPPFYINDTNPKKIPCVLERSPYGQNAIERIAQIAGDLLGYCAVRQDMRGTHDSQGNFSIWHDSANDAYDTIEWIISQPWSNGQVFETGASADGIDQFAQIIKPHPALRGQFVVVATTEGYETFFVGGSFRYALIDGWLNGTVPTQSAELEKFVLTKEQPDLPWWDCVNGTKYYQNVNWPSMMYAGWYDIFQQGNLRAWEGYQYHSNPAVRGQSKLVIDPCGHCQAAAALFPRNTILGRALLPLLMALDLFADHNAVNKTWPSPPENVKDLTFYVMASDEPNAPGQYWSTMDEVPAATFTQYLMKETAEHGKTLMTREQFAAYEKARKDKAATIAVIAGETDVKVNGAVTATSHTYTFNPLDPVPTVGGNNLEIKCGPLDQREIEKLNRQDVLVFTSPPLTEPMALTGPLTATVYISTNVTDTDMVAKLIDVYPTNSSNILLAGASILINDGIADMRWRKYPHTNLPQNLSGNPADVYEVSVTMWNTSYVFNAGHQIRIHVSSSNYPRFLANPNNGLPKDQQGNIEVAETTLWFNDQYPSALVLPVVTLDQIPPFPIEEVIDSKLKRYEPNFELMKQYGLANLDYDSDETNLRSFLMNHVEKANKLNRPL